MTSAANPAVADMIRGCIQAGRKMQGCNELAPAALAEVFALLAVVEAARLAVATYPFRPPTSDIDWYMAKLRDALEALYADS